MSVDVFPEVYVEKARGRRFVPWSVKTRRELRTAAPLQVEQGLSPRAYGALMDRCVEQCPDGATFAAIHERTFERFAARERVRFELPPDHIFGAGALTVAELRDLAAGPPPASIASDADGPSLWREAAAELQRWATVVEAAGGDRVVYWFWVP